MRKNEASAIAHIRSALDEFERDVHPLPGITSAAARETLTRQLVDSVRRVTYARVIGKQDHSERRKDPADTMFDPLKAAVLHYRAGNLDEACWLVFLFVHFGKHRKGGYLYAQTVYGRFGEGGLWDWKATSRDPAAFRDWLDSNHERLRALPTAFGNHRKYETLDAYSKAGTGSTVASYVAWVAPPRSHEQLFDQAVRDTAGDPRKAFHALYASMSIVRRFGRTARFDYLAMVGKLGFAPIEPDSAYLSSATGPVRGSRLLFGAGIPVAELDRLLISLDEWLQVGMQVIEDAVCNWQKSPAKFKSFRG